MTTTRMTRTAIALGLALGVPAYAQQQGNMAGPLAPEFVMIDRNGDGALTAEEAAADTQAFAGFESADENDDGKVSRAEYDRLFFGRSIDLTVPIENRGQLFSALDRDGDGTLSKAEAAGDVRVIGDFERADADGNGRLERAEMDHVAAGGEPAR